MQQGRQLQILVCDDSMLIRKKLSDIVQELNCIALEAKNGQECIDIYQKYHPDAVFLDIVMPEVDGISALKKMKELDQSARIFMISSSGTATKLKEALLLGAADFIQKPFDKQQIVQLIQQIQV